MDATSVPRRKWSDFCTNGPGATQCFYSQQPGDTTPTYHACLAPNPVLDAVRSRPRPRPYRPRALVVVAPEIRRMVRVLKLEGFTHTEAAVLSHWPKPVLAAARRCGRIRHLDGPSWAWARAMARLFHAINQPELASFYRKLSNIQFHRNRAFARVSAL